VWVEVAGALAATALIAVLLFQALDPGTAGWMRTIVAVGSTELLLIGGGLAVAVVAKIAWRRRRTRVAVRRPPIEAAIWRFLAGEPNIREIIRLGRRDPGLIADCLDELLRTLSADARAPVVRIVLALGLLERWRRECHSERAWVRERAVARLAYLPAELGADLTLAALGDPDDGVRRAAARCVARTGHPRVTADAIVTVTGRALTDRALFVDELRVQGTSLRGAAFAPALDTRDAGRLVAALEMIRACGRGLEIPNLHQLTRHEDAAVRAAALRVVPYDLRRRTFEDTLLGALSDADDGVRIAAIAVLGEFGSHEAIPGVARCLRAANPLVVVASAHALAALGPVGRRRLEAALLHGAGEAPAAALEALGLVNSRPYAGAR
jgi:HEAT repeat protein